MANIVIVSGSPSAASRSGAVLRLAQESLESHPGIFVQAFSVRDFPAEDLLLAKFESPAFAAFQKAVAEADALLIATPVYKAAYTGSLKALLDILPQHALRGKVVLPLATGGSPAHLLAIDYALKPVLGVLGASHVLQGVYVVDSQVTVREGKAVLAEEIRLRLDASLSDLVGGIPRQLSEVR